MWFQRGRWTSIWRAPGGSWAAASLRCELWWAWARVTNELREKDEVFFPHYMLQLVVTDLGGRLSLDMAEKLWFS